MVADKRVYAHEALHFQEKLQHASYKQPVAAWSESDSDSDSEDEDVEERDVTRLIM